MSSTRLAPPGSPLRQERFASDPLANPGLLGNLVAKRCCTLLNAADRELIWFLQFLSHEPGGLMVIADELRRRWPQRIATKSMQRFGSVQVYGEERARMIRAEIPSLKQLDRFERESRLSMALRAAYEAEHSANLEDASGALRSKLKATTEPAHKFKQLCEDAADLDLVLTLANLCLDPKIQFGGFEPWYFPTLIETLREFKQAWVKEKIADVVTTEIGHLVADAFDFALQESCMVIVEGLERTGKSFAARHWCVMHPGRARFVQVPPTNADTDFLRAVAAALGVGINVKYKAYELRAYIEQVLHTGDLILVLDDAQWLWWCNTRKQAQPSRIEYVMAMLCNHGVPVALVATPQYAKNQVTVKERIGWRDNQWNGRIMHYEKLPASLSIKDLRAVARRHLPEADADSIEALALYAQTSTRYMSGIEAVVKRARFLAQKEGSPVTQALVVRAMEGSVMPSDQNLKAALDRKQDRKRLGRPVKPAGELEISRNRLTQPDSTLLAT